LKSSIVLQGNSRVGFVREIDNIGSDIIDQIDIMRDEHTVVGVLDMVISRPAGSNHARPRLPVQQQIRPTKRAAAKTTFLSCPPDIFLQGTL
jgi:hypothetical protein